MDHQVINKYTNTQTNVRIRNYDRILLFFLFLFFFFVPFNLFICLQFLTQVMSNALYLTLLEQLSQYDFELEQLSKCFVDGFNQLSRANYYNKDSLFGSKYGSMYYDMNYEGQLYIKLTEDDSRNGHHLTILNKSDLTKNTDTDLSSVPPTSPSLTQTNIRKRGSRNPNEIDENTDFAQDQQNKSKSKGPYDPIKMFAGGFSIPRQLRHSQQHFQSSIPIIQSLINRRNNINRLIDQLKQQD